MNDLFGLAPNAATSLPELRARLSTFGPQTSRYLLSLPEHQGWRSRVLESFNSSMGEMERQRLNAVLTKAVRNSVFIQKEQHDWDQTEDWIDLAIAYWKMKESQLGCGKIYVADADFDRFQAHGAEGLKYLVSPDDDDVLSPAAEGIPTEPQNYWKVSELLCSISAHIHLMDPFFNPLAGEDKLDVFRAFVEGFMSLKKPTEINFWVRWGVDGARREDLHRYSSEVRKELASLTQSCRSGLSFFFHWVDDRHSLEKMHARFLLTEKGGIHFDQGFQRLRSGRKNLVSPLSLDVSNRQFKMLTNSYKLPFKVLETIRVTK